ncbi:redox-regulated ATPase YchF [bacterium F11]|nr:redox-regulated ATPase YchF [bacterium F11]
MEIGIIGLPNVGKSSLFNALTAAGVPSENFPFTTIEPNVGVVPLKDERLDFLANLFKIPKKVAAPIRFVDIAGLVPGASKGEGLGNKFLGHIREVDAICQIVRCFEDKDVVNVLGELDPIKDVEVVSTELLLADLEHTEKMIDKVQGAARTGQKEAKQKRDILEKVHKNLKEGRPVREHQLPLEQIHEYHFLTAKPVLYVGNVGESSAHLFEALVSWAKEKKAPVLDLNAKLEEEIMALPPEERGPYREALETKDSGLDRLTQAGHQLLNLITFFTANPKEAHAWNIPLGSSVLKAAGKVHTDMEKGFIRAEVYPVEELRSAGSHSELRQKGKIRMEGKDYNVRDGDVVYIHFKV